MFSIFTHKLDTTTNKFEICICISAIIYVILHYIVFNINNEMIKKFKYIFYGIVLVDIIYAMNVYKNKSKIEPITQIKQEPQVIPKQQQQTNQPPEFFIERPYLDENITHNQQYIPFNGNTIIPPVNLNTQEKDMKMQAMNEMLTQQKQKEIIEEIQHTITNEEINKLKEKYEEKKNEIVEVKEKNEDEKIEEVKEEKETIEKEEPKEEEIEDDNEIDEDNETEEIELEPVKDLSDDEKDN